MGSTTAGPWRTRRSPTNEPGWARAIQAADLLPIEIFRAESFIVRVVVGGALRANESEEWVGRFAGAIRVPDGKLAIVGGGLEFLAESQGRELDDWVDQYVQTVEVPPGEYAVEMLAYIHGAAVQNAGAALAGVA